jgi:hypothetical protein
MPITVSRPINGISINGDEYLTDESGGPIEFETVKESTKFLVEHNYTITDLPEFDFNFEEEPGENPCLLTAKECEDTIAACRKWGRNGF